MKSYANDKCLIESLFNSTAFFATMIVTLILKLHTKYNLESHSEKCPNTEFFLVRIFGLNTEINAVDFVNLDL